jgi:hypothetical protein
MPEQAVMKPPLLLAAAASWLFVYGKEAIAIAVSHASFAGGVGGVVNWIERHSL